MPPNPNPSEQELIDQLEAEKVSLESQKQGLDKDFATLSDRITKLEADIQARDDAIKKLKQPGGP